MYGLHHGAALGAALATILAAPTAATARSAVPGLAVAPGYGPPLTTIKVIGQGFCGPSPGCAPLSITISYVQIDSSHITWTAGGSFTAYVQVPGSVRPGSNPVIAQQTDGSTMLTARTTFAVTTNIPAPVTYPTPSSLKPPGGFPPTASPTSATTVKPPVVRSPTTLSPTKGTAGTTTAGTRPRAAGTTTAGTGTRAAGTTTSSLTSESAGAAVKLKPGSSGSDSTAITAGVIGGLAIAASAAGLIFWRRRRTLP